MWKKVVLVMAVLVVVLGIHPVSVVAQDEDCMSMPIKGKIMFIAKRAVVDPFDEKARACYDSLDNENKAAVFEAIAVERGIPVDKLREEANGNEKNRRQAAPFALNTSSLTREKLGSEAITSLGGRTYTSTPWRQPIERIVGEQPWVIHYANNSWQDPACDDGDLSDVDYVFTFTFPSDVTNPSGVRSFSWSLSVDSMLVYYQYQYGGIDGRGNTGSPHVRTCLGDRGVATAGGEAHVRNWLALYRW